MSSSIFQWRDLSIEQDDYVFKIGTDAILLATWVGKIISNPFSILDAGTGSGVIALMLSELFPDSKIVAIDKDENAVDLTENNVRRNRKNDCIIIRKEDVIESPTDEIKFELVVSNPPYYFGQLQSSTEHLRKAKHAVHNNDEWMNGCVQRLSENGHLFVIIPHDAAYNWIQCANEAGLYCMHRVDVKSFEYSEPVRTMLHLHKTLKKPSFQNLVIYGQPNTYTKEYLQFTEIKPAREK